jgi:hypothetical protein
MVKVWQILYTLDIELQQLAKNITSNARAHGRAAQHYVRENTLFL